jgi:hypothetical protein
VIPKLERGRKRAFRESSFNTKIFKLSIFCDFGLKRKHMIWADGYRGCGLKFSHLESAVNLCKFMECREAFWCGIISGKKVLFGILFKSCLSRKSIWPIRIWTKLFTSDMIHWSINCVRKCRWSSDWMTSLPPFPPKRAQDLLQFL